MSGLLTVGSGAASAQSGAPGCIGETDATKVTQRPGPAVRFGINPRAVTGQIGPTLAPAVPEDPARHLAKLDELRRPGAPFPPRDYRWFNLRDSQTGHPGVFQNSGLLEDDYDEKPAFAAYRELVARYTALGACGSSAGTGSVAAERERGSTQAFAQ